MQKCRPGFAIPAHSTKNPARDTCNDYGTAEALPRPSRWGVMDGPPLPLTVGAASSARAGHSGPLRGVQTSCDPSYSSQAGWGWQLWPLERLPAGCRPMRREAWQAPNGLAADAATRALAAWGSSLRGSFSVACPSSTDSSDGGHVVGIAQHPCRMQGKRMPSAHAGAPASTVLSEKTGRKGPRGHF